MIFDIADVLAEVSKANDSDNQNWPWAWNGPDQKKKSLKV